MQIYYRWATEYFTTSPTTTVINHSLTSCSLGLWSRDNHSYIFSKLYISLDYDRQNYSNHQSNCNQFLWNVINTREATYEWNYLKTWDQLTNANDLRLNLSIWWQNGTFLMGRTWKIPFIQPQTMKLLGYFKNSFTYIKELAPRLKSPNHVISEKMYL